MLRKSFLKKGGNKHFFLVKKLKYQLKHKIKVKNKLRLKNKNKIRIRLFLHIKKLKKIRLKKKPKFLNFKRPLLSKLQKLRLTFLKKRKNRFKRNKTIRLILPKFKKIDLFYNMDFFQKSITSLLSMGKKNFTKKQIFLSFAFLKKQKKLAFILFLKILLILRSPMYFKPVYRSGELFSVPVPLSYLKQWFLCFKFLKTLEKTTRLGSFLQKLQGEYLYIYNDVFLNLSYIQKVLVKKKQKHFLPLILKKHILTSSFLLQQFKTKNIALVDNSSYFHYRW